MGNAFGANRLHTIEPELRCYERVAGIEFIERVDFTEAVRSLAYRPTPSGAQTRLCNCEPSTTDFDIDEERARSFISQLETLGVFDWLVSYRPAQGMFLIDGLSWRLRIIFTPDASGKQPADFVSEGDGLAPDAFEDVVELFMNMRDDASSQDLSDGA